MISNIRSEDSTHLDVDPTVAPCPCTDDTGFDPRKREWWVYLGKERSALMARVEDVLI